MNDFKKIGLYVALVVLALMLYNQWQIEHPPAEQATMTTTAVDNSAATSNSTVPTAPTAGDNATAATTAPQQTATTASKKLIWASSDVLKIAIDPQGGNVVAAYLLKYDDKLHSGQPLQLFNNNPDTLYIAQSGLTGPQGPDTAKGQATYEAGNLDHYSLVDGQDKVAVNLSYRKNGLVLVKQFVLRRGEYTIFQDYQITNNSAQPWQGNFYTQLIRHGVEEHRSLAHVFTYTGAALSSPSDHYRKISFSDMEKQNYSAANTNGWVAMLQHYFLSAWVPDPSVDYHYYTRANNDNYTVGMIGPRLTVAPGQSTTVSSTLYVGPAIGSLLDAVAPYLKLTIDYGWLWFISIGLFWVLKYIHHFIGNWGWSIIIVTLMIKAVFYQLSAKSYRAMAHMRRLQPKMQQIRERFADDRQAQSKAMMELYRKEKCNPLGGCLPMLVQFPFFIAFYYMIISSVELRQAPFLLWIHDLSVPDPYFILPVIMGATMFLQQRLSPPAPDPMQQKVMMFLPVIFTVMFLNFPAGLVLYWITNNVASIAQQWWITRQVERQESKDQSKKR